MDRWRFHNIKSSLLKKMTGQTNVRKQPSDIVQNYVFETQLIQAELGHF